MGDIINVERMTISIPVAVRKLMREIDERMEGTGKRVNWSSAASGAFFRECQLVSIREGFELDIEGVEQCGVESMLLEHLQNMEPGKAKKLLLTLVSQLL